MSQSKDPNQRKKKFEDWLSQVKEKIKQVNQDGKEHGYQFGQAYEEEMSNSAKVLYWIDRIYGYGKRTFFILILVLLLIASLVTGVVAGFTHSLVADTEIPTKEIMAEKVTDLQEVSKLYFAGGELITEVDNDIKREATALDQVSPLITDAFIATEDEYFQNHKGIVPKAIIRAGITDLTGIGSVSGGSTLTQQLIKQAMLTNEVSYDRKAKEILLSLQAEKYFTKNEILQSYLNISPFGRNNRGENIAGIETAAKGIFGVSAKDVSLPQAAFLAGIPQLPYDFTPYNQDGTMKEDHSAALGRYQLVLDRMFYTQKISEEEYQEASNYNITADFLPAYPVENQVEKEFLYHTVVEQATDILTVKAIEADGKDLATVQANPEEYAQYQMQSGKELANKGYKITTTVNQDIYQAMQETTANNSSSFGLRYTTERTDEATNQTFTVEEPVETGSVMIENKTGKIISFIGGINYKDNQVNHAFQTRRSPGSTIKPTLVYGPALDQGIIHPGQLVDNDKVTRPEPDGSTWTLTNYGGTYSDDFVTARESLSDSLNIPTYHIYEEMRNQGVDFSNYTRKLGLEKAISDSEYVNSSLALGGTTTGPTILEQTNAFAAIANDGVFVEAYIVETITNQDNKVIYQHESQSERVFNPVGNYLHIDMLKGVPIDGTLASFRSQMPQGTEWIAKTGTSQDYEDVWVMGSTPEITISSWLGYDNLLQKRYLQDSSQDATYGNPSRRNNTQWIRLVNIANNYQPSYFTSLSFNRPNGIEEVEINPETGTMNGEFEHNGRSIVLKGSTTKDLADKNKLPEAKYDFVIGADAKDIDSFWSSNQNSKANNRTSRSSSSSSSNSSESDSESDSSTRAD